MIAGHFMKLVLVIPVFPAQGTLNVDLLVYCIEETEATCGSQTHNTLCKRKDSIYEARFSAICKLLIFVTFYVLH